MSIYDKASLVLIPSGTKTSKVYSQKPTNGDGDFTFSRSTAATRVNASGNIEKETQNLLNYSNTFSTGWANNNSFEQSGHSGYDGTNDAWKLEINGGNLNQRIEQNQSRTGVQTFSVYAKAGTLDWMYIRIDGSGGIHTAYFDIQNGAVGATNLLIDSNIEAAGNDFYRCSITYNDTITIARIYLATGDGNTTQSSGNIYIQDAQLEQGLVARDYIETTTAAIYGGITDNVPRLDYTDSSCPALLLEPQRTNAMANSEYFGGYNIAQMTLEHNYAISPEGVQNATRLIENTAAGTAHSVSIATPTTSTEYAFSVYAKPNGRDFIYLYVGSGVGQGNIFDIANGTIGSNVGGAPNSTNIEAVGNGWYRCTIFVNGIAGSPTPTIGLANSSSSFTYTGDGTSGVLIYGATLEAGSYATSYIPTYGSAVTRNAETTTKSGLSNILGQSEGTMFAEFDVLNTNEFKHIINQTDSGNSQYIMAYLRNNGAIRYYYGANYVQESNFPSGHHKIAIAWSGTTASIYRNGSEVSTPSNTSISVTFDRANIGNFNGVDQLGDGVQKAMYFPTRLTNAELADLTTI